MEDFDKNDEKEKRRSRMQRKQKPKKSKKIKKRFFEENDDDWKEEIRKYQDR